MKTTTRVLLALPLLLQACGGGLEPSPPDDRGRQLTSGILISDLAWSSDGSELVFIGDYNKVMAVSANGGATRTLYAPASLLALRVVENNAYVVVPGLGTSGPRIVRVPLGAGTPDTILSHTFGAFEFAVSRDERFIAISDSLYDRVNGTRRALPTGFPWSFSSDGGLLLYEAEVAGGPKQLRLISTSDLSSQPLFSPPDIVRHNFRVGAHYWQGDDPHVLHVPFVPGSQGTKPMLLNARTGADREVATIDADRGLSFADVSGDGARIALWADPLPRSVQLFAIEVATGVHQVRATVASTRDVSAFVNYVRLSPDGNKVAYVAVDSPRSGASGITKLYVVDFEP